MIELTCPCEFEFILPEMTKDVLCEVIEREFKVQSRLLRPWVKVLRFTIVLPAPMSDHMKRDVIESYKVMGWSDLSFMRHSEPQPLAASFRYDLIFIFP